MDGQSTSEVIKAAATSELGILALLVEILAGLALKFFSDASENVKIGIFGLFFTGVILFGIAIFKVPEKIIVPPPPPPQVVLDKYLGHWQANIAEASEVIRYRLDLTKSSSIKLDGTYSVSINVIPVIADNPGMQLPPQECVMQGDAQLSYRAEKLWLYISNFKQVASNAQRPCGALTQLPSSLEVKELGDGSLSIDSPNNEPPIVLTAAGM